MKQLPFHELYEEWGATFATIEDWLIPEYFSSVKEELQAALNSVALLDRSYLGKVLINGPDAIDFVDDISSNDMKSLFAGTFTDTLFNTPDGRLIDYCRVLHLHPELLIISSFLGNTHLMDWLKRFLATQDVQLIDATQQFAWFTLLGPRSTDLLNKLTKEVIFQEDDIFWVQCADQEFPVIKNNHFLVPAYNLCFPAQGTAEMMGQLVDLVNTFGGMLIGNQAFQVVRMESGMPDWDTEITPQYNAHEARLLHAVSFTKEKYTGQEAIARMDTPGEVQKYLMIVELPPVNQLSPPLAVHYSDEIVGKITSLSYHPLKNKLIGLAYIQSDYTLEGLHLPLYVKAGNSTIPVLTRIPGNV